MEQLLGLRRSHPSWGAKKLLRVLQKRGVTGLPGRSACCDILKRHGLVVSARRRKDPGRPINSATEPNDLWTADFKGPFKTHDGRYCYPLTIVDGYSRFLLACQGLRSTALELARPVFFRLFQEYGLPRIIRTDNGVPFATTALGRLSSLSVWWIRLGIVPQLIEPAHPEQNGSHERMHRTLKRETTRPAKGSLAAQQVCFNRFRAEYNDQRPHEALGQDTPSSRYRPSPRVLPKTLPQIEYPAHYEVRYVSANGGIRWKCAWVCVTHTLAGDYVGLNEVGDGLWDAYFGPVLLGRMDERKLRIEDHRGRWIRRKVSPMSPVSQRRHSPLRMLGSNLMAEQVGPTRGQAENNGGLGGRCHRLAAARADSVMARSPRGLLRSEAEDTLVVRPPQPRLDEQQPQARAPSGKND